VSVPDRGGKQFKRRTARDHGCEQTPVSGRQQDTGGLDWENAMFAAQVKLGYDEPAYLRAWLNQIVGLAKRLGKVGVLVRKPKRMHDDNALVVLRYADWLELHGPARMATGAAFLGRGAADDRHHDAADRGHHGLGNPSVHQVSVGVP